MKPITWTILLLGAATGLTAQTLTFGEISLGANGAKVVDVILTSGTFANQIAGLQFDLSYDPTQLNVVVGLGTLTANAGMDVNFTALPAANLPSPTSNNAPGQRAILIGCCTATQTTPTSNTIQGDGVVATLTITTIAGATPAGQVISMTNGAGTGAGANNVAPISIPLVASGSLDLYHTYLVGGVYTSAVYPPATIEAPGFGTGKIALNDVILLLLVSTNAAGYPLPAACSDLFDAMDTSPVDTATTRGGDGLVKLADVIVNLERSTNAQGFTVWPIRTTRNACTPGTGMTANLRRPVAAPPEVQGTLVLGATEGAGSAQERVPVYLLAGRDLTRTAFGFSLGDQQSQLRFEAAPGLAPSLLYDSQPGIIAAAWLEGSNLRAGQRLLLGYVVGPAGSAANVRVFGTSATALNNYQEVGLDVAVGR